MSLELEEVSCDVCGSTDSTELMQLNASAYHRCNNCGLIYAKFMPADVEEVNEEAFAQELEKYASKVEKRKKSLRKKLRQFDRYRSNGNFLEIGCNAGATLVAARENGWRVKGVDLSKAASNYAREQFGLEVFTGTVEEAAFPDNYFDLIYTNATLEHVRHPLSLLKECQRILRKGGVFYADTVNWDSYTREILGEGWHLIDPLHHIHLFTPENVKTLCQHAGLEHVKTWTTGARVKANARGSTFHTPWYWHLAKGPLSAMTRFTQKGDSIEFIAMKG